MKCIWRQIRRLSPGQQQQQNGASQSSSVLIQQFHNSSDELVRQIDTTQVFGEVHAFLTAYPSSSWTSKPNDLPLRTVKTLVYHLAKAKRGQVAEELRALDAPDDAEIKTYISKLIRNGFQLSSSNSTAQNMSGLNASVGSVSNASFGFNGNSRSKQQQLQQENLFTTTFENGTGQQQLTNQLQAIFKKVSSPELTKEGLLELYEFKRAHPDVDVNR